MNLTKKFLGLCWFALTLAFVWAFMGMAQTYGGIGYLVHVGAGVSAMAAIGCMTACALIGFNLLVRLGRPLLLCIGAGCVAAYVIAGVFSGHSALQLLMPPMIERPMIWAYLLTIGLAVITLLALVVPSRLRGEDGDA
jgi:hypothetical protein